MGLQFVAHTSSSSLHTVLFVIRMKLTLCLIVLCSYLTLSAARTLPDRNDWENDADRTSHDVFHFVPYVIPPPPPPVPAYVIPPEGLLPPPPVESPPPPMY